MFTIANNLTLHYSLDGPPAAPALVFINSLGCDLRIWDAVIPEFRNKFRVLRYDQRGHGLSDAPPGPYTIHQMNADLAGLLDGLGIDTAFLAGISVGGLVAMDFALQYPERSRALVLCDTAPRIGTFNGWNERIQAVSERGLADMADTLLARWFVSGYTQEHPAEYHGWRNMLARTPTEGYAATCAALRDADLSDDVRAIAIPTLAVCGAEDQVVTPAQTREWAGCLPNARIEIIAGAAHLPCIEQPQALAQVIATFLQENGYAR